MDFCRTFFEAQKFKYSPLPNAVVSARYSNTVEMYFEVSILESEGECYFEYVSPLGKSGEPALISTSYTQSISGVNST